MANTTGKLVVPYIPWETFTGFIGHLKATAVPSRIDKSVMPASMPSLTRGQIQSAIRFLGLVDDAGTTTKALKDLVAAYETETWQQAIIDNLLEPYSQIIGELDLENATQNQLDERFHAAGVDGQMLLKSLRFYLAMMTASGSAFSPHLMAKRKQAPTPRKKTVTEKKSKSAEGDDKSARTDSSKPAKGTVRYPLYFKGKPDGEIVVPEDLDANDCKVIERQFAVLRAYAGVEEGR
jgi:hypothetical protein